MNVLISLHKGYGLGDCVQMSAVLRHVAKYRPEWVVDYQAEVGRHEVGRGLCAATFAYGEPYPRDHYDAEVQICLYDTWANWHDRPNTRVSSCLHERFGLGWDPACSRYQVLVTDEEYDAARVLTDPSKWTGARAYRRNGVEYTHHSKHAPTVAVHYRGDSSPDRKNLTHAQGSAICRAIERLGCIALLLDWRDESPLVKEEDVRTVGRLPTSRAWGNSAAMNCAVIDQCAAFVGIDSGPSKCASATDTPALVVWTGHHPAPFHDPAPNTWHAVPRGYAGLYPEVRDPAVVAWFEENYNLRPYDGDPVTEVERWLREVLS